ncbi:GIY-YIG nuclease family protein [Marinomonas pollencensis]|uniref:Putative endonuclease n=1 Tax=Marinomonas pollencensis TaxID=491954 RepID=A0A3E0DTV8_9GAMM|nr:GIY-YIG nuclease family protein [Marinomonas pollencensis]REG86826.1 putative endonuclease [Marinomonas pollencensis]
MSEWSLYIIKTRLDTLYTGVTTDVARRFKEHSGIKKGGARYLNGKGPLELVWHQTVGSRSNALVLEYRVKQLTKRQKLQIVSGQLSVFSLIEEASV